MVLVVKNLPAIAGDAGDGGFEPWVRKIPGGGNGSPLPPVFLTGEFKGQEPGRLQFLGVPWGSLGSQESDTTEHIRMCFLG